MNVNATTAKIEMTGDADRISYPQEALDDTVLLFSRIYSFFVLISTPVSMMLGSIIQYDCHSV